MLSDNALRDAAELRLRQQCRLRESQSVGERLAVFSQLQQRSFRVLQSSPRGYRHFLARNFRLRSVEEINGEWRPVSPARRAQQA